MGTAAQFSNQLRRQIDQHGEPVTLRRIVAGAAHDLALTAFVRGFKPDQIAAGVQQGDRSAVLHPDDVVVATWLSGVAVQPGENPDRRVPKKGDKLIVAGRVCNIEAAEGVYLGTALVRINLVVRG